MAERRHMDSWDWCGDLGHKAGIYGGIGYLVLLCVAAYDSSVAYEGVPAGVYVVLVLGLLVSVASTVVANATTGPVRSGVLAGLAALPLIGLSLALLVSSEPSEVLAVFFFVLAAASISLTVATMLARGVNAESQTIRWMEFAFATAGIFFPVITAILLVAAGEPGVIPSAPGRSPGFWGGLLILDIILLGALSCLALPIVGLVNSMTQRNTTTLASVGLLMGKIAVALLGAVPLLFSLILMSMGAPCGFALGLLIRMSAILLIVLCPMLQFIGALGSSLVYVVGEPQPEDGAPAGAYPAQASHAHPPSQPALPPRKPAAFVPLAGSETTPPAPAELKSMWPTGTRKEQHGIEPEHNPYAHKPARKPLPPQQPISCAPPARSQPKLPPPRPGRPSTTMSHRDSDVQKQLGRLDDLLARGLLTQADYERKRKEILGRK